MVAKWRSSWFMQHMSSRSRWRQSRAQLQREMGPKLKTSPCPHRFFTVSSPYSHPTVAILAQAHWPCLGRHGGRQCQCRRHQRQEGGGCQRDPPLGVSSIRERSVVCPGLWAWSGPCVHDIFMHVLAAWSDKYASRACLGKLQVFVLGSAPLIRLLIFVCLSFVRMVTSTW